MARHRPIRIVFKNENQFVCGICRTRYANDGEAHECLENCKLQKIQNEPIAFVATAGRKGKYKCSLCQRMHESKESAAHCFYECRRDPEVVNTMRFKIYVEKGSSGENLNGHLNSIKLGFQELDLKKSVVGLKFKSNSSENENNGSATSQPGEQTKKEISAGDAEKDEGIPPRPELLAEKFKEKFSRDGSKYKCVVCQEKCFLKTEAEECFDNHVKEEKKADEEWLAKYGGNSGVEVDKKSETGPELTELEKKMA